jgi:hypothetical protein
VGLLPALFGFVSLDSFGCGDSLVVAIHQLERAGGHVNVVTSPCGRRFKVCKGPDLKGRRRRIAGGDYLPSRSLRQVAMGDGAKELVKLRVKGCYFREFVSKRETPRGGSGYHSERVSSAMSGTSRQKLVCMMTLGRRGGILT